MVHVFSEHLSPVEESAGNKKKPKGATIWRTTGIFTAPIVTLGALRNPEELSLYCTLIAPTFISRFPMRIAGELQSSLCVSRGIKAFRAVTLEFECGQLRRPVTSRGNAP